MPLWPPRSPLFCPFQCSLENSDITIQFFSPVSQCFLIHPLRSEKHQTVLLQVSGLDLQVGQFFHSLLDLIIRHLVVLSLDDHFWVSPVDTTLTSTSSRELMS